jgi:hypothetical protein
MASVQWESTTDDMGASQERGRTKLMGCVSSHVASTTCYVGNIRPHLRHDLLSGSFRENSITVRKLYMFVTH